MSTGYPANLSKDENKSPKLSQGETTIPGRILGKLNWVAGMTRPEISFLVCETSTRVKDATVSDLIVAIEIVKFIQNTYAPICILARDLE